MKLVQVENHSGLARDMNSGAIVNVDDNAYKNYQTQKASAKQKIIQEQAKEERINKIEQDVSELKTGINKILEILSNVNS